MGFTCRLSMSLARCVTGKNASSLSVLGIVTSGSRNFIGARSVGSFMPGRTGLNTIAGWVSLPSFASCNVSNPGRGLRSPFNRSTIACCSARVKDKPAIDCAASTISIVMLSASCATAASAPGMSVDPSPAAEKHATKRRRFIARRFSSIAVSPHATKIQLFTDDASIPQS